MYIYHNSRIIGGQSVMFTNVLRQKFWLIKYTLDHLLRPRRKSGFFRTLCFFFIGDQLSVRFDSWKNTDIIYSAYIEFMARGLIYIGKCVILQVKNTWSYSRRPFSSTVLSYTFQGRKAIFNPYLTLSTPRPSEGTSVHTY
jgi:hypothetical protein